MRTILVLSAWLACMGSSPLSAQDVRFAQITDVHLFDTEGKKDSRPDNERALRWAIDEINRRNQLGPPFEFVVVTGDLGLEKVVDADLARAAAQFRPFLERSLVRRWLLVPGNNDLLDEQPSDIARFHKFVQALVVTLDGGKDVLDFAPAPTNGDGAMLVIGQCVFLGLDNSSFKSNDSSKSAKEFEPEQLERVRALQARIGRAKERTGAGKPAFVHVFCHVPDTFDPYLAQFLEDPSKDRSQLKEGQRKKVEASSIPAAAWTVEASVRDAWNALLADDSVLQVFAGHFHSSDRSRYETLDWTRSLPGACDYPAGSIDKWTICPPIAVKNQLGAAPSARGFLDVTIDSKTGKATPAKSAIQWFEPTNADSLVTEPATLRAHEAQDTCSPSTSRTRRHWLVPFLLAVLVLSTLLSALAQSRLSKTDTATWLVTILFALICMSASALGLTATLILWLW